MTEFFYRYIDGRYAPPADEFGDAYGESTPYVRLEKYAVVKHTPKGEWIERFGTKRFILRDARKRFALPTKELALESFLMRKAKQRRIYVAKLNHIDQVVDIAIGNSRAWQKAEEPA